MFDKDKNIQKLHYDKLAKRKLLEFSDDIKINIGSVKKPEYFRAPYLEYEKAHIQFIDNDSNVLEIGSSTGLNTLSLLQTDANIFTTDISINSAIYLQKIYKDFKNLRVQVADMENLPFKDKFFDVVCSEGSLSYGDNKAVMNEIYRVLKYNGVLIVIDSLNHNPFYKFN